MIEVLQQREVNEITKERQKYFLHASNRFQAILLQLWGENGTVLYIYMFFFLRAELKEKLKKAWWHLEKERKPSKLAWKC